MSIDNIKLNVPKKSMGARTLSEFLMKKQECTVPGGKYYNAVRSMLAIRNNFANEPCNVNEYKEMPEGLLENLKDYEQHPEEMTEETKGYILNTINRELNKIRVADPDKYNKLSRFGLKGIPLNANNNDNDEFYRDAIHYITINLFGYFGQKA